MDTGIEGDETELGVLGFSVGLEVLADCNRILHEVPKVLGNGYVKS